jgi:hypothetical protein
MRVQAPHSRVVRITQPYQQVRVTFRVEETLDRAQNLRQRFGA